METPTILILVAVVLLAIVFFPSIRRADRLRKKTENFESGHDRAELREHNWYWK
jgi:NADH:ubiquinone oxidoreductase subunit 3 (subunit A)